MKKVLKFTIFILILFILVVSLLMLIPDEFKNSYQRAMVLQYDYYKSIKENKIVFVGGSSLSFGYDMDRMEELTGKKCPILGNHVSCGLPFLLELTKANLISGDIVVIEFSNGPADRTDGAELILTGIGKRYDMYRYIPSSISRSLWEAYPAYLQKNLSYWRSGSPYSPDLPYSIDAYDERGNMIYNRAEPWITEEYLKHDGNDDLQYRDYYSLMRNLNMDLIEYLNDYTKTCSSLGVDVYVTVQPVYDDAIPEYCVENVINEYDSILRDNLEAQYISSSLNYIFPRDCIFDGYMHLNSAGALIRTERLFTDLNRAMSEKNLS